MEPVSLCHGSLVPPTPPTGGQNSVSPSGFQSGPEPRVQVQGWRVRLVDPSLSPGSAPGNCETFPTGPCFQVLSRLLWVCRDVSFPQPLGKTVDRVPCILRSHLLVLAEKMNHLDSGWYLSLSIFLRAGPFCCRQALLLRLQKP